MKVAILMGSPRDDEKMAGASEMLERFEVEHEVHVMSAHRNPEQVGDFASNARDNGFAAIICGAGMAAHLAGAVAAHSTKPVIGIPIESGGMGGIDSLLSTAMMPPGVPVATVATVATGTPGGIIAVDNKESIPPMPPDSIGIPITGFVE